MIRSESRSRTRSADERDARQHVRRSQRSSLPICNGSLPRRNAERDEALAERDEALAQQTATAEVLQVINSSPGDLAPVFDAILEKATRLCEAAFGVLWTYDGELYPRGCADGASALAEFCMSQPPHAARQARLGGTSRGEDVIHIADLAASEALCTAQPRSACRRRLGGARTLCRVALRKEGALLGLFTSIVKRFGRLPTNRSRCCRISRRRRSSRWRMRGSHRDARGAGAADRDRRGAAGHQFLARRPRAGVRCDAREGASPLWGGIWRVLTFDGECVPSRGMRGMLSRGCLGYYREQWTVSPASAAAQLVGEPCPLRDIADDGRRSVSDVRSAGDCRIGGARSLMCVALRKDDTLLGVIAMYRQEVRPFSDKQIALLQNFAAQAVIAMENARLLTETREAISKQQTATAEVLQVINSLAGRSRSRCSTRCSKRQRVCAADHARALTLTMATFTGWRKVGRCHRRTGGVCASIRESNSPPHGSVHGARAMLEGAGCPCADRATTNSTELRDSIGEQLIDRGCIAHSLVPLSQGRQAARHHSASTAKRSSHSPTSRSRCCRISRTKRSSRWRTRGC